MAESMMTDSSIMEKSMMLLSVLSTRIPGVYVPLSARSFSSGLLSVEAFFLAPLHISNFRFGLAFEPFRSLRLFKRLGYFVRWTLPEIKYIQVRDPFLRSRRRTKMGLTRLSSL
jgi:hypothetical protein